MNIFLLFPFLDSSRNMQEKVDIGLDIVMFHMQEPVVPLRRLTRAPTRVMTCATSWGGQLGAPAPTPEPAYPDVEIEMTHGSSTVHLARSG